ncbi:MAG: hypothetical protein WCV73_05125 [Patescibacteria group bacterium]|jgi:hypothetical protein
MNDFRVPKSVQDSWIALYDHLESIQETLERGESHSLRNLTGTMRLLIADRSTGSRGGLLRRLVDQIEYKSPITWGAHHGNSLNSFLKCQLGKISVGGIEMSMNIEEFIRDEAQRSGSSHDDPNNQNIFGYSLRLGKSERADPYRGVLMSLGLVILVWGNEFYNKYAPGDLRRRRQVS